MLALQDYLNATGDYNVIYLNVEVGQAARNNVEKGVGAIVNQLAGSVNNDAQKSRLMGIVNEYAANKALSGALQYLSESSDKPVVLFIDEIDSLVGDTLISVLRQIRLSYSSSPVFRHLSLVVPVP